MFSVGWALGVYNRAKAFKNNWHVNIKHCCYTGVYLKQKQTSKTFNTSLTSDVFHLIQRIWVGKIIKN